MAEAASNDHVRMILHTGGSWMDDEYTGNDVQTCDVELPISDLTFSQLMDHVRSSAPGYADQKLTYKFPIQLLSDPDVRSIAVDLRKESDMVPFMDHVRKQVSLSRTVDLYLG